MIKGTKMAGKSSYLAIQKWLFCNAKPTLLLCKTAAFGMQNNRFYNTLAIR